MKFHLSGGAARLGQVRGRLFTRYQQAWLRCRNGHVPALRIINRVILVSWKKVRTSLEIQGTQNWANATNPRSLEAPYLRY